MRQLPIHSQSSPWRSKVWRCGSLIFFSFAIINFSALSLAPASILTPLESIQFVSNVAYSRLVHRCAVSRRMYAGVSLAVVGTILAVVFGAKGTCHSREQLESYWQAPAWWAYLAIIGTMAAMAYMTHRVYRRRLVHHGVSPPHPALLPMAYTLYCALIGGSQLIVHAKAFSIMVMPSHAAQCR